MASWEIDSQDGSPVKIMDVKRIEQDDVKKLLEKLWAALLAFWCSFHSANKVFH